MEYAPKPRPMQGVNEYREQAKKYGYPTLDTTRDSIRKHGLCVADGVRHYILEAVGNAGLRHVLEESPNLFQNIEASLTEAFLEGHLLAWQDALYQRSNESQAATGRMIVAMLKIEPEEKPELTAIRILAANAGVEIDDKNSNNTE